jgi:uncharacterized metal-binding protein YceD (DUF177 family)
LNGLAFYPAYNMQAPLFKNGSAMPDLPQHIVRLSDLAGRQETRFDLQPDAQGRAAIADALGIPAVRKLKLAGRLVPVAARDWRLEAHLGATVVQDCVATLAPVTTRLDDDLVRHYLADMPAPGPGEVEMPEDDSAEPLPVTLDLAQVMIEALALVLPPYPRAAGVGPVDTVYTEPGKDALRDEDIRPFAGLADLQKSLGNKDK